MAVFGLFHFMSGPDMAEKVPIPGGIFWVYLTGAALIAAAVSIMIRKKDQLAGLLLGIMLLIFALSIHLPGVLEGGDQAMRDSMPMFLKDTALAGAAWLIASQGNK
ncbi:MAG: DoxX family protein [Bacteroidetes bacterium]|nr:MAG: DoxX family protein [Bacteroidota bacterium]